MTVPRPDTPEAERFWQKLAGMSVDFSLIWRERAFGLLFIARTISMTGSLITFVAIPYQMFQETHSSLHVGLLGVAEFVPVIGLALVGGAISDTYDRRKVVTVAEAGAALVMAGLVVNALLKGTDPWVLYVAAALLAGLTAIQRPSFDALIPRLVKPADLPAASALTSLFYNVAAVAGMAVGGALIALIGLSSTYILDLVSFFIALLILVRIKTPPTPAAEESPSVKMIVEGVKYAWAHPVLLGTYAVDMNAMFFAMPMALFPQMAARWGGPTVLGFLYAAPAVGAAALSVASGWTERIHHHGRAIVLAVLGWGVAMALVGVADDLYVALVFLLVAGAMDCISGIFRMTIWNQIVPDSFRGRLAGIEMISWSSGPQLAGARAGAVDSWFGLRTSLVSGGVACVIGGVALTLALPQMWAYDARVVPDEVAID